LHQWEDFFLALINLWLVVQISTCQAVGRPPVNEASTNLPVTLNLNTKQVSLVSSGVPLGAVGGALMLGPLNEVVGRRMAIIVSLVLYTVGAALEAGAINVGMMVAGRIILGLGVGLEGGLSLCTWPNPYRESTAATLSPFTNS
jgi:MFS family permease